MREGVQALSEREKETLRLLIGGHDAKSIALALSLSVHTVNDHLREARRKLNVGSSREAARLLAQAETPNSLGAKDLGMAQAVATEQSGPAPKAKDMGRPFLWLGGATLIMSLVLAGLLAAVLTKSSPPAPVAAGPAAAQETTMTRAAREWASLLDAQRYGDSWEQASTEFKKGMSKDKWADTARSIHDTLGPASSRTLVSETRTNSPPNAPPGEYETIRFRTDFTKSPGAVETISFFREGPAWKIAGYFIR